jgi:hypothetical protein
VKRLITLAQYVLKDLGDECCTSTARDFKTLASRTEHEGLPFLGITLANFGKDLEKGLDQGFVGSDHFAGFQRRGGLPLFLGGFLCRVFDASSGRLLDNPDIACIRAVRQITLMWAKMELETTKRRQAKALSEYVECEKEVRHNDESYKSALGESLLTARFRRVSVLLWAGIFTAVDQQVYDGDIVPNHSAGATADRLSGNRKYELAEWTTRLDSVQPFWDALLPNVRYTGSADEPREPSSSPQLRSAWNPDILEPGDERPVKVILVPKTIKTPRVIAEEPTCMQYMQQGVRLALTREYSKSKTAWNLTGWTKGSQEINRSMAQKASKNGDLATLDLSEASDRVSNQHVLSLLAYWPHLRAAVDACRSRKADVLGHGVIRLAKFASMGSALTFPVEAMIFTTIIFTAIEEELRRPLTRKDIKSLVGQVRVYGDDIIVPVRYVPAVLRYLELFGLKVNLNKSFWNGKFRESCGGDYYDGVDVSITRIRRMLPSHRKQAEEIVSTVSLRNRLYKAGLWQSAAHLDRELARLIPMPVVAETSPALGRHSFLGYETQRMSVDLQRAQVRAFRIHAPVPKSKLDGVGALLKCLLPHRDLPFADADHLQRAGRPKAVSMRLGWVNSY